jgi:hypothetical protein
MNDSARGGGPLLQATLEQLDDLDALIHRMLEVPVNELPQEVLEKVPAQQLLAPPAAPLPPAKPSEPFEDIREIVQERVNLATLLPKANEIELPAPVREIVVAPPLFNDLPAELAVPKSHAIIGNVQPKANLEQPSSSEDVAPWLVPFWWINQCFEGGTSRLGSPGRWLQGRWGRTLIGVTGLVLLAGAIGWGVLDWLGWFGAGDGIK